VRHETSPGMARCAAPLRSVGALTDLTPFLSAAGPAVSGGTVASRPAAGCVPRMRCAQEAGPSGPSPAGAMSGAGAGNPARSVT
jgi:hypothetical protein